MRASPVEVDASELVELVDEPRVPDDVDCGAGPELFVEVLRGLKVLVELGLLLEPADTEVAVVDMVPDCRVVDPEETDCDADPELPPVEIDTGMLEVLLVPEAKLDVPDVLEVLLPVEENPVNVEDDTAELVKNDAEDEGIDGESDEDEAEDEDKDEAPDENIEDDVDEIEESDEDNDEDDEDADDKDDDEEDDDDEDNNEDDDDEVRRDEVELVGDGQDAAGGGFPYIVKYGLAPVLPHGEVGAPEQGKGQLLSAAAELLHGA